MEEVSGPSLLDRIFWRLGYVRRRHYDRLAETARYFVVQLEAKDRIIEIMQDEVRAH